MLASFLSNTSTTVLSATLPLAAANLTIENCTATDAIGNTYELAFVSNVCNAEADFAWMQAVPAGVDALPGLHSRAVVWRKQRHPHQCVRFDAGVGFAVLR